MIRSTLAVPSTMLCGRRSFSSGLNPHREKRLKSCLLNGNAMGRDISSAQFESKIKLVEVDGVDYLSQKAMCSSSMVVDVVSRQLVREAVQFPSTMPSYYAYKGEQKANVPKTLMRHAEVPLLRNVPGPGGFMTHYPSFVESASQAFGDTSIMQFEGSASVVTCVEPVLDVDCFEREEAEVEMIGAFRNILMHLAEDSVATTLHIPALCVDTCGDRMRPQVPKLNQAALLKGFHRLSNPMKDILQLRKGLSVEVLVPTSLWSNFTDVFSEEPWATPESVFSVPKQSFYPSLPPPTTLIHAEGWIGNRPELVEAIETKGKSLLEKPIYTLEGTLDKPGNVLETMQLYDGPTALKQRLENERKTAEVQFGKVKSTEYKPLTKGLQGVFFD